MAKQMTNGANEKEMIFMMGLPGSGKSTIAAELYGDTHSVLCADAIKESHPAYVPENAPALHMWSMEEYEKRFMQIVTGDGRWIIDGTGVNAEALVRRMTIASSFGFKIKLFYVKVSLQTALRRAATRERKVPEDIIKDKARNISTSFDICSQYADDVEVVSNDTDRS